MLKTALFNLKALLTFLNQFNPIKQNHEQTPGPDWPQSLMNSFIVFCMQLKKPFLQLTMTAIL